MRTSLLPQPLLMLCHRPWGGEGVHSESRRVAAISVADSQGSHLKCLRLSSLIMLSLLSWIIKWRTFPEAFWTSACIGKIGIGRENEGSRNTWVDEKSIA